VAAVALSLDLLLLLLLLLLLGSSVLLDVRLWVRQVAGASRVTAANRALLEVPFQDVTAGERIVTQEAHVGTITRVCKFLSKDKIITKGNWTYV